MILKTISKTKRYDFNLTNAVVTKSADGSDECIIEGYANTSTKDRVGDVVLPVAFAKSLETYLKNPVLLANHDWNDPCGRVLEAKITENGLWIKARISDTRPDIKTLIREGCLSTFSIGYNELVADFDESTKTKYIKELELLEISVVTVPANTEAMFTQATAKTENEASSTDKAKSTVRTAAELKAFIAEVKAAVGTELNTTQVLAVCEFFNDLETTEMKTKELIALLRGQKSAEQATAAPAEGAKADQAKPAGEAPAGDALLKEILAKLDAVAQGLASLMEGKPAEAPKAEEKPKDEKPTEEKPKDAPEADSEKCDEEDMSDEEVEKQLAEIESELAAIEDAENE